LQTSATSLSALNTIKQKLFSDKKAKDRIRMSCVLALPPEKLKSLIESTVGGLQMSVGGLWRRWCAMQPPRHARPAGCWGGILKVRWADGLLPDANRRKRSLFGMSDGRSLLNGHFRCALSYSTSDKIAHREGVKIIHA
jgi:hypothetical protein